jgi:hypothetical protein
MVKPITPKQVDSAKQAALPEAVIEIFNAAIAESWDGRSSTVMQNEVVTKIAKALEISRDQVFKLGYVDVEPIYRKAGWKVKYDKPGYCESYEAYFEFSK